MSPRLRLGLLMWLTGMAGVVVLTHALLPELVDIATLPMPFWAVVLLNSLQTGVLLALAVWAGVALAPRVGLRAPVYSAAAERGDIGAALSPQWRPGLIAGVVGGFALFTLAEFAPALGDSPPTLPLVARVLYGGITEELLLRWGLMTLVAFLAWKTAQRATGAPSAGVMWFAIAVSALLFAAGHLPTAAALAGGLTQEIVTFVMVGNTLFGLLFGWLYWRYGLEAAIIAHALAHVVAFVLGA